MLPRKDNLGNTVHEYRANDATLARSVLPTALSRRLNNVPLDIAHRKRSRPTPTSTDVYRLPFELALMNRLVRSHVHGHL